MERSLRRVHLSTLVLLTVGTFDLVSTLIWMNKGGLEGNPLFAALAVRGSVVFALAKLAFLAVPVAVIEWARARRPLTAEIGTWVAASAYAWLWVSHVVRLSP